MRTIKDGISVEVGLVGHLDVSVIRLIITINQTNNNKKREKKKTRKGEEGRRGENTWRRFWASPRRAVFFPFSIKPTLGPTQVNITSRTVGFKVPFSTMFPNLITPYLL